MLRASITKCAHHLHSNKHIRVISVVAEYCNLFIGEVFFCKCLVCNRCDYFACIFHIRY